jgi:hypothetical protein
MKWFIKIYQFIQAARKRRREAAEMREQLTTYKDDLSDAIARSLKETKPNE